MLLQILSDAGLGSTPATIIVTVLALVIAYLLGSLNFGIILSKLLFKEDVRKSGSGNA